MTIQTLKDYIETIAKRHAVFKHTVKRPRFFEMNLEEILNSSPSYVPGKGNLFLILEPIEYILVNQDSDFPKRVWGCAITIASKCEPHDYKAMRKLFEDADQCVLQIIQKIYQESEDAINGNLDDIPEEAYDLVSFEEGSVEVMAVGPILESVFGVRVTFKMVDEVNLMEENEELWH